MQTEVVPTPPPYSERFVRESFSAIALGWALTPLFILASLITLITWHPLIAISRRVLPNRWHDLFIALGNRVLQYCFYLTGGSVVFRGLENIPKGLVFVVVSNHQSLFDIPILIWLLRGRNAKFIAKKSLGRGIPSASYVLRTNGHALIDRGNALQATTEIRALAQRIAATGGAAVIFPEGTRARDGKLKSFKPGGLKTLLAELGAVSVVPVSIDGAWRIMRFKFLPVPFGVSVVCTVHKAIAVGAEEDPLSVSRRCEDTLRVALEKPLGPSR